MSAILLLGASGFIGTQVRGALENDPRCSRVTCVGRDRIDLLSAGRDEFASLIADDAPAVVVNCTGRLDGSAADLLLANTIVSARLTEAVATAAPGARIVRIGSAGEYGPMLHGQAVREDDAAHPASAYGLSHHTATRVLELAAAGSPVEGVTLRVFNPIGPGLREETLLGRAAVQMREALATGVTEIGLGPLDAYRDFVDVRDVATAVAAAAFAPDTPARVVNIGSGSSVPCRQAVSLLAEVAGFRGEIREARAATGRSASVGWSLADITLAEKAYGWRPVRSLRDSVEAIWADVLAAGLSTAPP